MMKLKTKVAINTIIQVISKIFSTLLGLIAIGIITRYLGKNGFGEYTTILTFVSFFAIIADLGFTLITAQMISKPDVNEEYMLGNLFTLRIISAFVIIGLAPICVLFFPYTTEIKEAVLIVSLAFFFIALNQVLIGLFQKKLRMDKVSIAEIANRLILFLGVIFVVNLNYGIIGILIATIIANLINFLILFIYSKKFTRIKLRFDLDCWKEIIIKTWPLAITITLNLIYLKSDTLLLSIIPRQSEIGIISEVGIYGAAYKVIDVLITLPFMFAGIILPILTMLWAEKKKIEFNEILQKTLDTMIIVAIPLMIGTQLVSERLMTLVAGKGFNLSGPILNLLIIAAGAIFIGNIPAHAIIAINKQKKIIPAYIFVAITSLFGYLYLIPRFSYWGATWITIYSEVIISISAFYLIYKYNKFIPNVKILLKSLLASIIMYVSVYPLAFTKQYDLYITIPLAIVIYLTAMFITKGITKKDIVEIIKQT